MYSDDLPWCENSKQKYQENFGICDSSHFKLGSEINHGQIIRGVLNSKKGNNSRATLSLDIGNHLDPSLLL